MTWEECPPEVQWQKVIEVMCRSREVLRFGEQLVVEARLFPWGPSSEPEVLMSGERK
jgi:hypothetical protein